MAQESMFCLAASARLFAGDTPIALSANVPSQGFRTITSKPVSPALRALVQALAAQDAFCLSDKPLPAFSTADAPDFLTLTGGSSGAPQAILRSQASWIASFKVHEKLFDLTQLGSVAVLGGLAHSLSLYAVLEGLHLGLDVHVLSHFAAARQRDTLRARDIQTLYATPTQLRLLTRKMAPPLPGMKRIFCGGGALDARTQEAVQTLFPRAEVHQFYGAAETSFVTIADGGTPQGSVGKPYAGVEIALKNKVLWVRSPYLFKRYASAGAPSPAMQDGFLSTGDLARKDADGNLWITGRASRQVNVADQLVSPETVETFVSEHPDGGPCAVIPTADPLRGHRLALILQGPHDPVRAETIKLACLETFGPLIAPRHIAFHPELPLLSSGKIDLHNLNLLLEPHT